MANVKGVIQLCTCEAFRGIFQAHIGAPRFQGGNSFLDPRCTVRGDFFDPLPVLGEHYAALQLGCGVVQMDNSIIGAVQGLESLFDQLRARLGQDLNRDVFGDQVVIYDMPGEVEVRVGSGWKANLDFLETQFYKVIEKMQLFLPSHGFN